MVMAQNVPPIVSDGGGLLPGPDNNSAAGGAGIEFLRDELAPAISSTFTIVMIALATLLLIIAGVMYVVSQGDQEMQQKARTTILWTILGLIAAMLSYFLVNFLVSIDFSA